MTTNGVPAAEKRLREVYERAEASTASAVEDLVSTRSFGRLLITGAENVAALSRLGGDVADLILRNLRIAGRADITRLACQLQRTEDKLDIAPRTGTLPILEMVASADVTHFDRHFDWPGGHRAH